MLQVWHGSTCVYSVQAECIMLTLLKSINKNWTGNNDRTVVEPFRSQWGQHVLGELCNKGNKPGPSRKMVFNLSSRIMHVNVYRFCMHLIYGIVSWFLLQTIKLFLTNWFHHVNAKIKGYFVKFFSWIQILEIKWKDQFNYAQNKFQGESCFCVAWKGIWNCAVAFDKAGSTNAILFLHCQL